MIHGGVSVGVTVSRVAGPHLGGHEVNLLADEGALRHVVLDGWGLVPFDVPHRLGAHEAELNLLADEVRHGAVLRLCGFEVPLPVGAAGVPGSGVGDAAPLHPSMHPFPRTTSSSMRSVATFLGLGMLLRP